MFPFALSLFDTGLLIAIIVLMLLYLIVLIKLKPPTEGEKILKKDSPKQKIKEDSPTRRWNNPLIYHETQEETVERVDAIEEPKPVSKASTETEKNKFSRDSQRSGCSYHFGYLRDHPKNTPIPNECLTCTKIMECLLGTE